jgi:diguanylate cyclase (GGDEF)-like protein/hemerythrin-like metal-binding protein
MLNDDISWLSDPHTQDLFMQFPLPLAIVGSDGSIKQLNQSFTNTFDAAYLESESLQKILHDHSHAPVSLDCNGCATTVFVRTVNVGDNTLLVLEKSAEIAYGAELAEMHSRIMELEKLSATDRLTGAWNRAHFDKIIAIESSRSVRYLQPLALIFFDIDHFKRINDSYGHAVGDVVLCELVKVVRNSIRASDMLFRWGGEEFVVLAPATSYRSAASLAETLRVKVEQHTIETAGHITISLGVAEHVSDESENACLQRADAAMYAAKNSGRNRVVVDQHGNSDVWAAAQSATILGLSWHESYDCGEATIDQEHRQLFELANALISAAFKRESNPHEFGDALNKLLAHLVQHFADEEAILARHHYADLGTQVHAHKMLMEHALRLRDTAAAGGVTIGELVDFLADEVVARHMLKVDRQFYPLFKTTPSAQTI